MFQMESNGVKWSQMESNGVKSQMESNSDTVKCKLVATPYNQERSHGTVVVTTEDRSRRRKGA